MIISKNKKAPEEQFVSLLEATQTHLKQESESKKSYYLSRGGVALEEDVLDSMIKHSKGTEFEGSIERISGQKFPDIIANKYYGVEVKTSKGKDWKSTGNSVLESSRVDGIEKIYLFFGKLSNPVDFKCRKYEDCLYEVAVTHSPRYLIDMNLCEEDTIFSKLGIRYDDLRTRKNPIKPIVDYYRSKLKEGDELWWMDSEKTSNLTVTQWSNLAENEKRLKRIEAFALFPELFSASPKKYLQLSSWLVSKYGIVSPSLRDTFSAGGQMSINLNGNDIKLPRIYGHLIENIKDIKRLVKSKNVIELSRYWREEVANKNKIELWTRLVVNNSQIDPKYKNDLLKLLISY